MGGHNGGAGIWVRGLYSPGAGITHGGKLTVFGGGGGAAPGITLPYGIDIDGCANVVVDGFTVEGAGTAAFRIRNGSTNVHLHSTRSNNGAHVIFDGFVFCRVSGGLTSGQASTAAYYNNNARNCRADLAVETNVGHFDATQRHGAGEWQSHMRGDSVISVANTVPSDGYWEIGDEVRPRVAVSGQPSGWRCTANGNPGTWKAMANIP
jgi:hypothetical protein